MIIYAYIKQRSGFKYYVSEQQTIGNRVFLSFTIRVENALPIKHFSEYDRIAFYSGLGSQNLLYERVE